MLGPALLMITLVVVVLGVVALGVVIAAQRAALPSPLRGLCWALGGWLTLTSVLAASGALTPAERRPPVVFLLAISAIALAVRAGRSERGRRILDATPAAWLIGLQVFRVAVELLLHDLGSRGLIPRRMTWSGTNFDVLVGLSAPVVALFVARGRLGAHGQTLWHLVSLGLVVNVVLTAVLSLPSPLHVLESATPLIAVTRWPMVWLPTVLVPIAVASHLLALGRSTSIRALS